MSNGDLFSYNTNKKESKNFGKVTKFSSTSSGICAINKKNKLLCYDSIFNEITLPENFAGKA